MTASTFAEQIAMKETARDHFVTTFPPRAMGNLPHVAYGGCALAASVAAAGKTVRDGHHLYSAHGNFLGPASTNLLLHMSISRVRDTKTFSTRYVQVFQTLSDGSSRLCLVMIADYMVPEATSVLTYSARPDRRFSNVQESDPWEVIYERLLQKNLVHPKVVATHREVFSLGAQYFDQRLCPEGFATQTLYGMAKRLPTSQDHLPMPSRASLDWFKTKVYPTTKEENMAALAFQMDGATAFLPLTHSHRFIDDVSACSSLDFALRIFSTTVDMGTWLLKEMKTSTGGEGRTYTEARLWDEEGNMMASMTQQCVLRPKPVAKPVL